jgi:hypothetical protein
MRRTPGARRYCVRGVFGGQPPASGAPRLSAVASGEATNRSG